jgi:DNA-binding CsgD family transcriptional regulator
MIPLSPRETEVADLVAEGLNRKEIASQLGISVHTVKNTLRNIFAKIGVNSCVKVAIWSLSQPMNLQTAPLVRGENPLDTPSK